MASSVITFTMASIMFFFIGFLCAKEKRKRAAETVPPAGGQTQIPYYDDVVLQQTEQELEVKVENVAYFSVQ